MILAIFIWDFITIIIRLSRFLQNLGSYIYIYDNYSYRYLMDYSYRYKIYCRYSNISAITRWTTLWNWRAHGWSIPTLQSARSSPLGTLQSAWLVHTTLQFLRSAYRLSITWTQQSPWSVVGTLRVGVGPEKRQSLVEGFPLTLTGLFIYITT